MVFDLGRIEALLDSLGSPQRAYPAIHITGTNGKTSTARMIDELLRAHGLRTGRYTSPHLESVREQISIEAEPISEERFVEVYEEVAPLAEYLDARSDEPLTYFDMTTAMAFAAFADAPVDVAVVEVGLGGAEDSTNVLQAQTAVITPIGLDHTEWLGETIEEIAFAKAGIVHKGATLICALQPEEAMRPILERCADVGATLAREGSQFGVVDRELAVGGQVLTLQGLSGLYDDIFLPLHGAHQARTRRSRWPRSRRSSVPAPSGGSNPSWSGPASRRRPRPAASSGCAVRRRSCWTPRTTRPACGRPSPRSPRSSRSAG